jgi:hypothetical protein
MPSTLEDVDGNCPETCSMLCLPLEGILVVMWLRNDVGSRRIMVYSRETFSNVNISRDSSHIHWQIAGRSKPIAAFSAAAALIHDLRSMEQNSIYVKRQRWLPETLWHLKNPWPIPWLRTASRELVKLLKKTLYICVCVCVCV